MQTVLRFAPSPTGNLHIGNARTALFNWLFARKTDGAFILRFDDTDSERSRDEYVDSISTDLNWLGISPNRVERQSARLSRYREITDELIERGLLYPCFETPDELDRKRKRLAARGKPPVYDRASLRLKPDEIEEAKAEGRRPHFRFLLPNYQSDPFEPQRTEISWTDLVVGHQSVDLASVSDPVLVRADGSWLYTLPSVIDDIDMGVTHVIRGADHITNTGVQIALIGALGAEPPIFAHHNLLTSADGEGLSKRLGSLSLQSLRQAGYEPMAVASLAVLIGGAGSVDAMEDMDHLVDRFDLGSVGKSPAKFDRNELDSLNRRLVHGLDWEAVKNRFEQDDFDGKGAEFWNVIRENLDRAEQARDWWENIINARSAIDDEDRDFLAEAASCLPEGPLNGESWRQWTELLKERTGRKGRALFMPLRKALTGMEKGPEMGALLPIIGREKTLARLSGHSGH